MDEKIRLLRVLIFAGGAPLLGDVTSCSHKACDDGQGGTEDAVCGPDAQLLNCACWAYDGAGVGHVYESPTCECPFNTDPTWN
jgi:hypothetical protein